MTESEAISLSIDECTEALEFLETSLDMVRWAMTCFERAQIFYGHGTDNPQDEAFQLVLGFLDLPPDTDLELLSTRILPSERRSLIELIVLRVEQRIPTAYLLRQAWLSDLKFYVDERVLIPRSPIAELIERHFSPFLDTEEVHRIADIGTGSGCLACLMAHNFPEAVVDAVDISPDALEVAAVNIEDHGFCDRINLIESDLMAGLEGEAYDIIVANLPYVNDEAMDALPEEYGHEPNLGLEGGEDGLDLVVRLVEQAKTKLTPNGLLIVELGFNQEAFMDAYPDLPVVWLDFENGGEGVFALKACDFV